MRLCAAGKGEESFVNVTPRVEQKSDRRLGQHSADSAMQAERDRSAASRGHGHIVSRKKYLLKSVPTLELGNRAAVFVAINILTIDKMRDLTLRAGLDGSRQQGIGG